MNKSDLNSLFSIASFVVFLLLAGCQNLSTETKEMVNSAAKKPDFTGVWTMYIEPGQSPFGNFGAPPPVLPFTEKGKKLRDEYNVLVGAKKDNPGAFCASLGMPGMMESAGGYPIEFIQKPDQFTIIYEVEGETRRVLFGDRIIPKEQRYPNRQGYSTGHWEGDTLVVETDSLTDGQDQLTHPHSEEATIVEKFKIISGANNERLISYEMTMTDPVYYTQPIVVTKKFKPLENGTIMAYNCPGDLWEQLLQLRRDQLHAGKPVTATMADVYDMQE